MMLVSYHYGRARISGLVGVYVTVPKVPNMLNMPRTEAKTDSQSLMPQSALPTDLSFSSD
jgi:hypothetical protein